MASRKKGRGSDAEAGSSKTGGGKHRPFAAAFRDRKVQNLNRVPKKPSASPKPATKAPSSPRKAPRQPADLGAAWERYGYEDRAAYLQEYADVKPLGGQKGSAKKASTRPATSAPVIDEESERLRLARLLSQGLRFRVSVDEDGFVEGYRDQVMRSTRRMLERPGIAERTLDLHGYRSEEARRELSRFIREQRRQGRRAVRVIHGKGRHSEGGSGVLADRVVEALTSDALGFAVLAFRSEFTADQRPAALLVLLSDPGKVGG